MTESQSAGHLARGNSRVQWEWITSRGARILALPVDAVAVTTIGLVVGAAAAVSGVSKHRVAGFPPWELLVLAAFSLSLAFRGNQLGRLRVRRVDIALATYIVLRVILELINQVGLDRPGLYTAALQPAFLAIAYLTARLTVSNLRELRHFILGLVAPMLPSVCLALFQISGLRSINTYVTQLTGSAALLGRANSGNLARASGLVGQWTDFGSYLCGVIALLMVLMWLTRGSTRASRAIIGASGIAALGVLTTLTFSVIVAAFAVVAFSLRTRPFRSMRIRPRWLLACLTVLLVSAPLLIPAISHRLSQEYVGTNKSLSHSRGLIPESLEFRIMVWEQQTVPTILARPLTGWGQGVYTQFRTWEHQPEQLVWPYAESQWFDQMMTGGLIQCAGLIVLLVAAYRDLGCAPRRLGRPIRVLIITMSLVGFTVPCFTDVGLPLPLWSAIGALLSVAVTTPIRTLATTGVVT